MSVSKCGFGCPKVKMYVFTEHVTQYSFINGFTELL